MKSALPKFTTKLSKRSSLRKDDLRARLGIHPSSRAHSSLDVDTYSVLMELLSEWILGTISGRPINSTDQHVCIPVVPVYNIIYKLYICIRNLLQLNIIRYNAMPAYMHS